MQRVCSYSRITDEIREILRKKEATEKSRSSFFLYTFFSSHIQDDDDDVYITCKKEKSSSYCNQIDILSYKLNIIAILYI